MARRSARDKAETHERILQHASEAFRGRGTGVGIGDLMKELGLTHGGFYRHFGSKEDLLVEAVTLALDEISERLDGVAQAAPGHEMKAIISAYLSEDQLTHPEVWCALTTLAPEMGRQPADVRARLDAAMMRYAQRLARYMPGSTPEEKQQTFLILFSGMAGAISMARVLSNAGMQGQVLAMARGYYLRTFAEGEVRGAGPVASSV